MRGMLLALVLVGAMQTAAPASPYLEFPAPERYPFRRSTLTARRLIIPPYYAPFRVRVYTTPPQQPFYNVPPYGVITPY